MTQPRPGVLREAVIDTAAIAENVRHLRRMTGTQLIAVVKADGYGHGAVRAAAAALDGGAERLGVSDVAEALALRRAGIDAPVVAWLHAARTPFGEAVARGVELGVSSLDQLEEIAAAATAAHPASLHVKVDTGLSRSGASPDERRTVFAEAARLERIGRARVVGVFSHLSNASAQDDLDQLARFQEALAEASGFGLRPALTHLAATHAAFALPETRLNCVRVGLGIYGLSPFADRTSAELGLHPAMTLRAGVAAVRRVPAGTGVSYGFTYRTDSETTLALVPAGYADGVPRQASNRGSVSIRGRRFPVAGRIAMDQFVVDVGDESVAVGDEVVVFGDPVRGVPSAQEWAAAADTIDYDIVTRVGPRVPRREAS